MTHRMQHAEALTHLVAADPALMHLLRVARHIGLADWCIGAGAIRNLVWNHLHPDQPAQLANDIDFVYFEPGDLSGAHEERALDALTWAAPHVVWDVVNQARVHLWYEQRHGVALAPIDSLTTGVAGWPETATCVGVRLDGQDLLHVIAPHGLDDLFNLVLRRSPAFSNATFFAQRLADKQFAKRWPGLQTRHA